MKRLRSLVESELFGSDNIIGVFLAIVMASCCLSIGFQSVYFLVIPILVLAAACIYLDVRILYFLLLIGIPVSTEVYLPNGLGTDVPIEQCMWALTVIGLFLFLTNWSKINAVYVLHPITLSIMAMLAWLVITTITSQDVMQSTKYLLAKLWYVVSMFGMTLYFLKSQKDIKKAFGVFFWTLMVTVVIVVVRHMFEGFSFDSINSVLNPFYRNHVSYACLVAIAMPYMYFLYRVATVKWKKSVLLGLLVILGVALFFSYTRAAIGAMILLPIYYAVVAFRRTLILFVIGVLGMLGLVFALSFDNNYLSFAPNYESTIYHDSFDDILAATYRFEDLSTMERVYRWVAGYKMISDRPILGFGPSNFYQFYESYSVSSFSTYVSDNEEKSGIHNYYLMTAVEQGLVGLLFFVCLIFFFLVIGEREFHSLSDRFEQELIRAALGSLFIILVISFMNDMLETDKVGSFFFLSLALIVRASAVAKVKQPT